MPTTTEPPFNLSIVSRRDWNARAEAPPGIIKPFDGLVEDIFIGSTYYKHHQTCHSREKCTEYVKQIDQISAEMTHPEIYYNFLVGGHDEAFYGRGWKQGSISRGKRSFT